MKSFSQYIQAMNEDINIVDGSIDLPAMKGTEKNWQRKFVHSKSKNLGEIYKGFSLYMAKTDTPSVWVFFIVLNTSKKVVGEIEADMVGKKLTIQQTGVLPKFRQSHIGASLAILAYKHLSKLGYTIMSDWQQSVGGASLWQRMLQDKSVSSRIVAVSGSSAIDKQLGQATKMSTDQIWGNSMTRLVLKPKK
jgi:hypothetical protein